MSRSALTVIGALFLAELPLSAQAPRAAPKTAAPAPATTKLWTPARTPWGDPDLQGLWPSLDMQGTPYERPPELAGRAVLTDEEFAARQTQRRQQAERAG